MYDSFFWPDDKCRTILDDTIKQLQKAQEAEIVYQAYQNLERVIEVKYKEGAHELQWLEQGDWIDCYTYEPVELTAGDFKYIDLGMAVKIPEGFEAMLIPRSSTFKRYGILQANSVGLIDNSYCGNDDIWMFPAYATKDVSIPKDTRLCQFRVQPVQHRWKIQAVDDLGDNSRGGLGSTGE